MTNSYYTNFYYPKLDASVLHSTWRSAELPCICGKYAFIVNHFSHNWSPLPLQLYFTYLTWYCENKSSLLVCAALHPQNLVDDCCVRQRILNVVSAWACAMICMLFVLYVDLQQTGQSKPLRRWQRCKQSKLASLY